MESQETMETEAIPMGPGASKIFTFSAPSILPESPTSLNPPRNSEQIFETHFNKNPTFTFAEPTAIGQSSDSQEDYTLSTDKKLFKPRISRNVYKPPANVFAQALKDTAMYEQLKKNTRTRSAKVNLENSITCINVPKSLLSKQSAKNYFTSFGQITKITIRPKKRIITVIYANKQEASVAYNEARDYLGEKFDIEWTKSYIEPKSPTKKKDLQRNIVAHLLMTEDDEVKSELEAMIGQEYNVPQSKQTVEPAALKRTKAQQAKPVPSKTTQKVEKAPVKAEKHKTDSQISDLLPNATAEELQSIIQQAALSSEDKYKVLEARDRLMRLKQVKSHSLATAKVTSGTCPDMCPEKERLMREAKRQVALYEVESNGYKINHNIAVKQYSRSSADQEEPMPHDLRSVASLKMTMSYLLHEIADLSEQPGTNLGEWYHFLWDRTRGIRKDITQQELCCSESVELVEQCARFHIVSSERLCAEDASIFDKKINSDNLTKCLQSLKYMYHDLRIKGVFCQNEAEFRGYIILLNLNDGNFVWELQRLPESIQKSAEVLSALEFYKTLESNNYNKFFKLVKETTYLNGCILLRYFNQVRLKALSVMVKAYGRTTSTAYPLYELIDILGFEDENEAIHFCEQLGLNVSRDELHVLLNRQNFSMPVLNIKQNRACNLIESKRLSRNLSMGQCIAGGQMPEKTYKYHKPHCSFDDNGYLLPEAINAEDQNAPKDSLKREIKSEREVESPLKTQAPQEKYQIKQETTAFSRTEGSIQSATTLVPPTSTFAISKPETTFSFAAAPIAQSVGNKGSTSFQPKQDTEKQTTTKSIFSSGKTQTTAATTATQQSIFTAAPVTASQFTASSKVFSTSGNTQNSPFAIPTQQKGIFSNAAPKNMFAWSSVPSTIFGASQSNVQTTTQSKISNTSNAKLQEAQNIPRVPSAKQDEDSKIQKPKKQEEERRKLLERINEDAQELWKDLQNEVVDKICSNIVEEHISTLKTQETSSKELVNEIINEVTFDICSKILKEELVKERKLHELLKRSKNKIVLKYYNLWKRQTYRRKRQRQALDCTPVWLQRQSIARCAQLLYSKEQNIVIQNMSKPQDKVQETQPYAETLAPIEVIAYTGIKENQKLLHIDPVPQLYWKLVISWPELQEEPLLHQHKKIMKKYLNSGTYTTNPIIKEYHPNQFESLHICIKDYEGFIADQHLIGADALLFITSTSERTKAVARRLTNTVLSRKKLMPMTLVFVVLGEGDSEAFNAEIAPELELLLESGYLHEYTIIFEKCITEKSILDLTQSAVLWLSVNKSKPNPLEINYIHDVVDRCLMEELWLRISSDSGFNTKLFYTLKNPCFIINLHNEAVTNLMDIILDPELFIYTEFAPEFKKSLRVQPSLPCSYEFFDHSLNANDYKAEIEKVMSTLMLPSWKYPWPIDDAQELQRNVMLYSQEALPEYDSNNISSSLVSNLFLTSGTATVSYFVEILLYILRQKIRQIDEDLRVIYNRNHIKYFCNLPWWFKSNTFIEFVVSNEDSWIDNEKENDRTLEPSVKKRRLSKLQDTESLASDESVEFEPLATFCENTQNRVMTVHNTAKEIENLLAKQRQQNSLFEERLRDALLNDVHSLIEGV